MTGKKKLKGREYKNLTLEFCDFHYFAKDEFPPECSFCFVLLKDGSLTCGRWWPYYNADEKGRFIRGTNDTVTQGEAEAWVCLDSWTLKNSLENEKVTHITIGSDESFTLKLDNFRSIAKGELPQNEQYCFLIQYDGRMSGGRWAKGGPYTNGPGYFDHAPAASIISHDEVWAWTALDPDVENPPKAIWEILEETRKDEKEQKKERRPSTLAPEVKFRYGYDIEAYLEKAFKKLQKDYPWATRESLDPRYRYAIEDEDGQKEYIRYYRHDDGSESRSVMEGFPDEMDAKQFISYVASDSEYHTVHSNKVIDEYSVPFFPVDLGPDWNLEHYIFRKRQSGHYTVEVQAGGRATGSAREFGITAKCMKQPTYDKFLDEYGKIVPGGPFGLWKEDLIDDLQLKAFLGYVPRKEHPEVEVVELNEMRVAGKSMGVSREQSEPVGYDEAEADSLFADLREQIPQWGVSVVKKNGEIPGYWAVLSDAYREDSFAPWGGQLRCGRYLAAVAVGKTSDIKLPDSKWDFKKIPAGKFVVSEEIDGNWNDVFVRYVGTVLPEMGYRLNGAVCEFRDAKTGKIKLYFPVRDLV